MRLSYLLPIGLFLVLQITTVFGDGKLSYGDKCSVQNAIIRVFTNTEISESEKCNSNEGLICTGTCTCPPTRVWDNGPLFGIFGGGRCIVGANGPCGAGDRCVANAICGENIPLCFCTEGYHAHEFQCISSNSHNPLLSSGSVPLKLSWYTYSMLIFIITKVFTS